MVGYGFKSQFVPAIEEETKLFTLRDDRINGHAKKGDDLHLWENTRTPEQRLIFGRPVPCTLSFPVTLNFRREIGGAVVLYQVFQHTKRGDKAITRSLDLARFAKADGFESIFAFAKWHSPLGLPIIKKHLVAWGRINSIL
jgi:hypothetical protein